MATTPAPVAIASAGLSAAISPLGAELVELADAAGSPLLWSGDPAVWRGRAPILFPIVGMLAGGRYRLDGTAHAMPRHGFARHSRFEVVARSPAAATFRLEASAATRAIYPFDFRLDMGFALTGATLRMAASIANLGDRAMPASFGFHPAFRWPLPYGEPRDAHDIRFARAEPEPIRRIDGDGLLTPAPLPTPVAGDRLALRDALFVEDALIFDRLRGRGLSYGAARGPRLAVDFDDLPLLGVWTKPGAGFVCIEPWQGIADPRGFAGDIRDKPGIIAIAPGATRELAMRVTLVPGSAQVGMTSSRSAALLPSSSPLSRG